MSYYLLLDNDLYADYEQIKGGFEILEVSHHLACGFGTLDEARKEAKFINNRIDDDGNTYKTYRSVIEIVSFHGIK